MNNVTKVDSIADSGVIKKLASDKVSYIDYPSKMNSKDYVEVQQHSVMHVSDSILDALADKIFVEASESIIDMPKICVEVEQGGALYALEVRVSLYFIKQEAPDGQWNELNHISVLSAEMTTYDEFGDFHPNDFDQKELQKHLI